MDEEVRIVENNSHASGGHSGSSSGGDGDRVLAWEDGLPEFDDLPPPYLHLIPPELASAFQITTGPSRTTTRASNDMITSFHDQVDNSSKSFKGEVMQETSMDLSPEGLDSQRIERIELPVEVADSTSRNDCCRNNPNMSAFSDDLGSAKSVKRPRMVWTAQMHKRFVDVVSHVGIKNSVPKMIMQMMNVEGLTRENVASHLQKYRLYLKRGQGSSDEGPSASDHYFESTLLPQSLHESGGGRSAAENQNGHPGQHQYSGNGHMGLQNLFPYSPSPPHMMHMPTVAMAGHEGGGGGPGYHGYEDHFHQHRMLQNFGSVHQYLHHVPHNGK